jgi:acetyl-CoA acyltransferase
VKSAVVVDVLRTASGRGKPGGALSGVHPADLLATVLRELVARNDLDPALVQDVIAGCVNQAADQALNIARTAALVAGFPEHVPGTTLDRQCGSSQQAVHFAAQGVMAGVYDVVVACGVESMSRVPMGTPRRGGHPQAPLQARYPEGLVNQGVGAELIAARWGMTREELDQFAASSHQRAAAHQGQAAREILGVEVAGQDGTTYIHRTDETLRPDTTVAALGKLAPSFVDPAIEARFPEISWSVTAGGSSPLTDGASAALIMSEERAAKLGLEPRARLLSFAVTGSDPLLMLSGVVPATEAVLASAGLTVDQIDAYEVNEAFAPVPLLWLQKTGGDPERMNPRGGAIALGHPLGASGTRLLCTLVHHLEDTGGRYGLQTMCEGGGMANATIVERL